MRVDGLDAQGYGVLLASDAGIDQRRNERFPPTLERLLGISVELRLEPGRPVTHSVEADVDPIRTLAVRVRLQGLPARRTFEIPYRAHGGSVFDVPVHHSHGEIRIRLLDLVYADELACADHAHVAHHRFPGGDDLAGKHHRVSLHLDAGRDTVFDHDSLDRRVEPHPTAVLEEHALQRIDE